MINKFFIPVSKIKKTTNQSLLVILKKVGFLIPKKYIIKSCASGLIGSLPEASNILKMKNINGQIKIFKMASAPFCRMFATYKQPTKEKARGGYEKNL